ncbi:tripartite tricarboxylate transporter substrate-binding protein [Dankookia sp. P2]|uniref:tripartite tricarboxylate transporter substrate-binding protein n=1 Tax=Dankookia sp. P2 TaxID=3423955 RepID=UPI003D66BD5A
MGRVHHAWPARGNAFRPLRAGRSRLGRALRDLITALREQPGRIPFATTGPATLLDLGVRHLFATAGLPIDAGFAVPFRGGGDAVVGLLEGRAQFLGTNLSDALPALRDGRLRGLVIGTNERLRILPAIATAREAEVLA